MTQPVTFCCPACRSSVVLRADAYECAACARLYPILFGIPDFRLRSDRYLSLEEERTKAEKLHEAAQTRSFAQLLEYYYEITDDVTPAAASKFTAYALEGARRAAFALDDFGHVDPHGSLLDLGCGSGGGVLAARGRFAHIVGVDIAMRWLIIARKRLEEAGHSATLVCADIESPPFADKQFSHILALDVIEHVYGVEPSIRALSRQLRPDGKLWMSASNRNWLGPHPATGIWAAALRGSGSRSISNGTRSYDPLRYVTLITPAKLREACERAGLDVIDVKPLRIFDERAEGLKATLLMGYAAARQNPVAAGILAHWGPLFQMVARAH